VQGRFDKPHRHHRGRSGWVKECPEAVKARSGIVAIPSQTPQAEALESRAAVDQRRYSGKRFNRSMIG
jgi:hypothetical protein